MYLLSRRFDVPLEQLLYLSCVPGKEYCLSVGVEPGPSCPPCHLVVLTCRNRLHPLTGSKPEVVADDDPPGGAVQSRSKGWRGRYALYQPFPESLLDNPPLFAAQAGMVEGRAL